MAGWVKVHRKILDHWVWNNEKYFRWWMLILLKVNYEKKVFPVNYKMLECNPGQSFMSLDTWAGLFGCSKKTVVKFFYLLKKDGMINTEIIGKGNQRNHLLTVLNWDNYQQTETEKGTSGKPGVTLETTPKMPSIKKEEERKKYIYDKFYDEQIGREGVNENYIAFVKYLFGENVTERRFDKVLGMKDQIKIEFLETLLRKYSSSLIKEKIEAMENRPDLRKKYESFYSTLNNWCRMTTKK